jgi:hypothetical protein
MLTKIQRSYEINHSMFGQTYYVLQYAELSLIVDQFQSIARSIEMMKTDNSVG